MLNWYWSKTTVTEEEETREVVPEEVQASAVTDEHARRAASRQMC